MLKNQFHFVAITVQILELIADKRGVDQSKFAAIHADLEKMKKECNVGRGTATPRASGRKGPPTMSDGSEAKRQRVS